MLSGSQSSVGSASFVLLLCFIAALNSGTAHVIFSLDSQLKHTHGAWGFVYFIQKADLTLRN